jgi:hypothetical protein
MIVFRRFAKGGASNQEITAQSDTIGFAFDYLRATEACTC